MSLVLPVKSIDDEELGACPVGVCLAADGGNVEDADRVGVSMVAVGAAVRGDVDGVRGVHEVERPAGKLVRVAALRSCTSHSALQDLRMEKNHGDVMIRRHTRWRRPSGVEDNAFPRRGG